MNAPHPTLLHALRTRAGRQLALWRDRQTVFAQELAVCAIFKDEARYLQEWLTFHHGVGVDHFYLYNNNSTDASFEVLRPWQDRGLVTLTDWPEEGGQVTAYNHCIRKVRRKTRWLALIDIDEFLFSPRTRDLREALQPYAGLPAVFVYWILFGSGGHQIRPAGSVLEAYTRCLDAAAARLDSFDHRKEPGKVHYVTGWAKDGKSIVNPRLVRWQLIHKPREVWRGEVLDENRQVPRQRKPDCAISCEVLRINHYWSKSIQDLTEKVEKGNVCFKNKPKQAMDNWLKRERELNVSEDTTILPLWNEIKARAGSPLPRD